jgi:hypothetical protein
MFAPACLPAVDAQRQTPPAPGGRKSCRSIIFLSLPAFCTNVGVMINNDDFSVVVKSRARPPKPWRWEIYRAGRQSPIQHSAIYFESMTEAHRVGKAALRLFLSECQIESPPA